MTAVQPAASSSQSRSLWRSLRQRWQRLIEPDASIQDPGTRRQVQLQTAFILVLIPLLFVGAIVTLQVDTQNLRPETIVLFVSGVVIVAAYGISRTRYFEWGVILVVTMLSLAAFTTAVANPSGAGTIFYAYIPLTFVIGGFLLRTSYATVLVISVTLLIFCMPLFLPDQVTFREIAAEGGIALTLGTLLIVFSVVRNLTERDRLAVVEAANAELRALRDSLEIRVNERTAQLRASAQVGQAAASVLDPERLLQEVVSLITDRFDFSYAAVFLLDETGRNAVLREGTGEAGRILKERRHQLEVGGQSMVGYVTAQRKARIALDVGADPVRFANPLLPDTRSEIALPLIAGGRMLGALDVQSTRAAAFDETNTAVLQSMADQIAIALNNAEQFKQAERQATLQASLNAFNRGLFGAESATDLYRIMATELSSIVPHDYLSLTLAQSAGGALREYVLHADAEPVITEGSICSPDNSLSGRAFATRHPAFSRHLAEDADLDDAAQLLNVGFQSALSLPLNVGDRILGTLNFASRQIGAFTQERSARFEQLAGPVAAALQTQRLAEAQQRSLREMEALTRQLTEQTWAKRRLGLGHTAGQVETRQYAQSGIDSEHPIRLPEIEAAIAQQAPVAWSQADNPANPSPYPASLAAPIMLRGAVLGALQVGETNRAREWSQDDITFIQAVADQVALALDNARLIEATERRAERERLVAEVSSRMFASNDLESIIQIAGQELGRVLRVDRAEIRIDPNLAAMPLSEVAQSGGNDPSAIRQAAGGDDE
jgi:GAF domain-containing protein